MSISRFIFSIFVVIAVFILGALFIEVYQREKDFNNAPIIEVDATLVSREYIAPTESFRSSHSWGKTGKWTTHTQTTEEDFVTLWEIENYGTRVCHDKEIFTYAKPKSILLIKVNKEEVRIVGIKK